MKEFLRRLYAYMQSWYRRRVTVPARSVVTKKAENRSSSKYDNKAGLARFWRF